MSKRPRTSENRAPFTREEIITETRKAALTVACLIANFGAIEGALQMAAQYLGVELENYDLEHKSEEQLASIPIEKHHLYRVVMDAYDYAYQTGARGLDYLSNINDRMHEVSAILSSFPQTDIAGEPSPLDRLNPQKFRQVLETFLARYNLDAEYDLSIRELALLASMGEAAVRTSLSSEGITTATRQKGQLNAVPHAQALSWLMGRRGFVPSARFEEGAEDISSHMRTIFSATDTDFPKALEMAMTVAGLEIEGLAGKAGVDSRWLQDVAMSEGAAKPDLTAILQVAAALQAPEPVFAAKAIEHLLSRGRRN